jgi:voltage-gated potassium channel
VGDLAHTETAAGPPSDDAAVVALVAALAGSGAGVDFAALKRSLRGAVAEDPIDAMLVMVAGGAFLFYVAEKDHNPKVRTFWDALVFISTCVSVGYADVFARTPAGQAIASAVMTFGPAMSGAILDEPRRAPEGAEAREGEASRKMLAVQEVIVDKLAAILDELRAARETAKT